MKEFFARLNPTERRFVVGVIVLFFLVINLVWVWPHFSDWGETKTRMKTAGDKLYIFENGTNQIPDLQKEIEKYQRQGEVVPTDDQALRFVRFIQDEAARSGVVFSSMSPQRSTTNDQFFAEQIENVTLEAGEKQLVDFLYHLGSGNSLIRVKVISVQPDQSHQRLSTRVTLVASYQKKKVGAATSSPAPATTPKPATAAAKPAATPVIAHPTNAVRTAPVTPPGAAPKTLTPPKK